MNAVAVRDANLVSTYRALATQVASNHIREDERGFVCTGVFPHPICNFGIAYESRIEPFLESIERENIKPHFNLYAYAEDPMAPAPELPGWNHVYSLHHMVHDTFTGTLGEFAMLKEASERRQRDRVATFMVDQFFSSQGSSVRRTIAQATACSPLSLCFHAEDRRPNTPVGAVMVNATGRDVGVYNLCVTPSMRERGIGSAMVADVLGFARAQSCPVVLQCDSSLLPWYEKLGFAWKGRWNIYNFAKSGDPVIMEPSRPYEPESPWLHTD